MQGESQCEAVTLQRKASESRLETGESRVKALEFRVWSSGRWSKAETGGRAGAEQDRIRGTEDEARSGMSGGEVKWLLKRNGRWGEVVAEDEWLGILYGVLRDSHAPQGTEYGVPRTELLLVLVLWA
ncbi:hypothetical protein CLCR_02088 [Cladophialophora carrionii]|uniref:Uncharacterized protein n=1 Tax=Cladophialophora carrionii TaxID=86049 RepID=A0A1C1CE24_9EURO|nr:hypothetical protein CLCR_02088 [Cladophialophora carrionii]